MGRVDYRAGLLFAVATIPGAIAGAFTTSLFSRQTFNLVFSVIILGLATFIILRPAPARQAPQANSHHTTHTITDVKGVHYSYSFSRRIGALLSFAIGWLSSMLGIGGGGFHVSGLVYLLRFPLHIATATSHFTLTIMSCIGSIAHAVAGDFEHGIIRTLLLSLGVVVGAQLGARLSQRLRSETLIRVLAGGLVLFGIRLAIQIFES
jgi:uncharacterized membrane protein YfcA